MSYTQMLILDALTRGNIGVWSMVVLTLDENNQIVKRKRGVGNLPNTTASLTELFALTYGLLWIEKLHGSSVIKVRARSQVIVEAITHRHAPDPDIHQYLELAFHHHPQITAVCIGSAPHLHELSPEGIPLMVQELNRITAATH